MGYDNVLKVPEGRHRRVEGRRPGGGLRDQHPATEFAGDSPEAASKVYDVRKPSEFEAEHVDGAATTPLQYLNDHLAEFSKDEANYVHCQGGYRSMMRREHAQGARVPQRDRRGRRFQGHRRDRGAAHRLRLPEHAEEVTRINGRSDDGQWKNPVVGSSDHPIITSSDAT